MLIETNQKASIVFQFSFRVALNIENRCAFFFFFFALSNIKKKNLYFRPVFLQLVFL